MKKFVLLCLLVATPLSALTLEKTYKKDGSLNVSAIGNIQAHHYEHQRDTVNLNEFELAFQSYIQPEIRADIILAVHEAEGGELETEEAYFTFFNPAYSVLGLKNTPLNKVKAKVGQKFFSFGKHNQLHPEQWSTIDKPYAFSEILGEESARGNGAEASVNLPLPFFSELTLGVWDPAAHDHEEEEEEEHEELEFGTELALARLWNSVALTEKSELEVGFSLLQGGEDAEGHTTAVSGLDVTYTHKLGAFNNLKLQGEWLSTTGEYERVGGYLLGAYRASKWWEFGTRLDHLGEHDDEEEKQLVSVYVMKQLTEVSKLKLQYTGGEDDDTRISAQIIFGVGPHSHVLQ
jgi:hypothetical protein